jgi:hypothetical protein
MYLGGTSGLVQSILNLNIGGDTFNLRETQICFRC